MAGNFFHTLGAAAELGRVIGTEDDQPGHEHVVVISHSLRRSLFGDDPNILRKTLQLDREFYTVIGVMPPAFVYPRTTDFPYSDQDIRATEVWIPAALTAQQKSDFNANSSGTVIGRLRSGVTLKQAQTEMSAIEARVDPVLHPPFLQGCKALLRPFIDTAVGPVRPLLWLLVGAVSFVLLIASSNVANLLLARAAGRVHEMGVRTALGAERARLVRQMLTEAVMLALGGGLLGDALAYALVRLVVNVHPGNIPRLDEVSFDARVLLFTAAVSLFTGLAFGLLPALAASRIDVSALLKQGGNKGVAGTSNRWRNGLIVTEVALSVILLAAAGLLIRTYLKVQSVDTGFASSTLSMTLVLDDRYDTPQKTGSFLRTLIDRVTSTPGVTSAGLINALPLGHRESMGTFEINGHTVNANEMVNSRSATVQYFQSMGIPLLGGRFFIDDAVPGHQSELLVSESFAKLYFPGESAVGQQMRFDSKEPWHTVVGVVADVRHSSLEDAPRPAFYGPILQSPQSPVALTVRSSIPPEQLSSSIRQIVRGIDPAVVPEHISTMRGLITEAASPRRFQTIALAAFAGVAVFLALVGLYGLMAYAVKQRTAEIGIRIALGASPAQVLGMVISKGLALTVAGLALGIAGALAVTRLGTRWLYQVSPADPITFLLVPALILLVAVGACLTPAWKATRIDPVTALRYE